MDVVLELDGEELQVGLEMRKIRDVVRYVIVSVGEDDHGELDDTLAQERVKKRTSDALHSAYP
jgi:hypothetical protein